MQIEQRSFSQDTGWVTVHTPPGYSAARADLVFAFFGVSCIANTALYADIRARYPHAQIVTVSTAGEIMATHVSDDSISLTAITLEKSHIEIQTGIIEQVTDSEPLGLSLARALSPLDLRHVLVFSDGLLVNGTALIQGMHRGLGKNITISGGLAGDGPDFKKTYVSVNAEPDQHARVVMIGFYGDISIGLGSMGGWDDFGVDRIVTKSNANTVYELDHSPILDLYKRYLGDIAAELPSSGLLFPLSIKAADGGDIVRTLLSIDETSKSITFAGDVPEGSTVRLMKANFERIIDAAGSASSDAGKMLKNPELALLISCIGRKLILKQRIEEEIDIIHDTLGDDCLLSGFYSYGEIGRSHDSVFESELHNQTMTVTIFSEK